MQKKTLEIIKENIKRMYSFNRAMKKHFYSLLFLFIVNIAFIVYASTDPERFSLPIFIGLWLVSAIVIIRMFYDLYCENTSKNLPSEFDYEYKIRKAPLHEIRTAITFIGHIHMRGFYCRIYIYPEELIIKFFKHCLVVKNPQDLKIQKFLFTYLADFADGDKFVQCSLNAKNARLLEDWQKNLLNLKTKY